MNSVQQASFYKKKEKIPLRQRLMQIYLRLLVRISKRRAAEFMTTAFMTPMVSKEFVIKRYEKLDLFSRGTTKIIDFQDYKIFTYQEGEPKVLLIYGWESSLHRFVTLIEEFRKHDIGFLAFDLPAHGNSSGKYNNAFLSSKLAVKLLQNHPTLDTIVGHSFGGGVAYMALEAMGEEHNINKLITVSTPSHVLSVLKPFYEALDAPENIKPLFVRTISERVGRNFEDYDWTKIQLEKIIEIYMIHDVSDPIISIRDAINVKDTYPYFVNLYISKGLGHRKIMHDPGVVRTITEQVYS